MTEPTINVQAFDLAAVLVTVAAVNDRTLAAGRCWVALHAADRDLWEQAITTVGEADAEAFARIRDNMRDAAQGIDRGSGN